MNEQVEFVRRIAHRITPPIVVDAIRTMKRAARQRRAAGTSAANWRTVASGRLAGVRLHLPSGAGEEWADAMLAGTFEPAVTAAIASTVQPGWTCFDVGGHVGYYTLLLASLTGREGEVHCFEPFPQNAARIREHVAANTVAARVRVHEVAISDRSGRASMVAGGDADGRSSMAHLEDARGVVGEWGDRIFSTFTRTPVHKQTLDALWASGAIPSPQVMKIDIEGAELQALTGSLQLLRATRPVLFVELHNCRLAVECTQILAREGYTLRVLALPSGGSCFVIATSSAVPQFSAATRAESVANV